MTTTFLSPLVDVLLHTLGRCGDQGYLCQVLRECGMDVADLLRQEKANRPYSVVWPNQGLCLRMEPIPSPEFAAERKLVDTANNVAKVAAQEAAVSATTSRSPAPSDQPDREDDLQIPVVHAAGYSWGLHSVSFAASDWPGPWPFDLDPESVTSEAIIEALPGGSNKTVVLSTPELICLRIPALGSDLTWLVLAELDSDEGKLEALTLQRCGDWAAAAPPPPRFETVKWSAGACAGIKKISQGSAITYADEATVEGATALDIDEKALNIYLTLRYGPSSEWAGQSLLQRLQNLGLADGQTPNLAGMLLFGKHPQHNWPMFGINAVAFSGTVADDAHRLGSESVGGVLHEQYRRGLAFIERYLRRRAQDEHADIPDPVRLLLQVAGELLVNALVHRDYFVSAPIEIMVFADRIEIINPGHVSSNSNTGGAVRSEGMSNRGNPLLTEHASHILPYWPLGMGRVRTRQDWPRVEFANDVAGNTFKATIQRPVLQGHLQTRFAGVEDDDRTIIMPKSAFPNRLRVRSADDDDRTAQIPQPKLPDRPHTQHEDAEDDDRTIIMPKAVFPSRPPIQLGKSSGLRTMASRPPPEFMNNDTWARTFEAAIPKMKELPLASATFAARIPNDIVEQAPGQVAPKVGQLVRI
jgi:hypothetical protein